MVEYYYSAFVDYINRKKILKLKINKNNYLSKFITQFISIFIFNIYSSEYKSFLIIK